MDTRQTNGPYFTRWSALQGASHVKITLRQRLHEHDLTCNISILMRLHLLFTRHRSIEGGVYTNVVLFVSASFSMRLNLLFTRHRSRLLLLLLLLNTVTILARNLHIRFKMANLALAKPSRLDRFSGQNSSV